MEAKTATLLHFYVAITLPQMPLSKIDGVVNLFSAWKAKERHRIFGVFVGLLGAVRNQIFGGQTAPSA